jgi:nondiscriminating glutamyl-tRNA synthetase
LSDTRVRFAPSPTGRLHIGGARTALFNYLFARHEGGRFILRIEDTDLERSSAELEQGLLDDIRWLGLDWDEGPGVDAGTGPYRQSERLEQYQMITRTLQEENKAYVCVCPEEELERKREAARAEGQPPRYDGTCRELSREEKEERIRSGAHATVRFRVPERHEPWRIEDLARGTVEFPPYMVGDFVIMRSNGMPTYNFAVVIDDGQMNITHVIRGAEHLSNTIRQLLIYEALGWPVPKFAHIPLILGSDRSKLSKRHGAPNIEDYRRRGYPAEALVNYLAFLGWSTKGEDEILSKGDLVAEFELPRVSDSPSIFDENKLNWVSAGHIRRGGSGLYLDRAMPFFPPEMTARYGTGELARIFDLASENLPCFERLPAETASFMPGPPGYGEAALEGMSGSGGLLAALQEKFSGLAAWDEASVRNVVKETGKEAGVKGKALYMPLRISVTGMDHGPDLVSILVIRGREDVTGSIASAIESISSMGG